MLEHVDLFVGEPGPERLKHWTTEVIYTASSLNNGH